MMLRLKRSLLAFTITALLLSLGAPPARATTSTADPNYPQPGDDIDADPLRSQFDRLISDVNSLWNAIGPDTLEANEVKGALVDGQVTGLPLPSCSTSQSALTWTSGIGFGCNDIQGGSLGPQAALTVLVGPLSGPPADPTFRQLTGDYLPLPSADSIGGVQSFAVQSHRWINGISTSGVPQATQPDYSDLSGQLPFPSVSTLGGVQSVSPVTHNWVTGISTLGVVTISQPGFGDISGSISVSQMASGLAASTTTFWRGDGTWAAPTGSINTGTSGQIGYYASSGTTLSPATPGNTLALSSGVVNTTQPQDRVVTGSTDAITSADCGVTVVYNAAGAVAISVAAAFSTGLTQGCSFTVNNKGVATVTITPTTSLIGGKASLPVPPGTGCYIRSDSTNYLVDLSACSALAAPAGNLATTPADNATCTAGTFWWDTGFLYVCTTSGTVKRTALSTF